MSRKLVLERFGVKEQSRRERGCNLRGTKVLPVGNHKRGTFTGKVESMAVEKHEWRRRRGSGYMFIGGVKSRDADVVGVRPLRA